MKLKMKKFLEEKEKGKSFWKEKEKENEKVFGKKFLERKRK